MNRKEPYPFFQLKEIDEASLRFNVWLYSYDND